MPDTDTDDGFSSSDDETNACMDENANHVSSMNNMPDYPHPSVAELSELSFEILPENFFLIAYGSRRTGKTHAISCLLESIKDRFDFAYLFSSTAMLHKGEEGELDWDMIREEGKFEGFDEDSLTRVIERNKTVKAFNNSCKSNKDKKPNRTLIIFDDFVHDKRVRYSELFTALPVLGRHYELSVICLSQGYSAVGSAGLNPATRQNSDMTVTFLPRNIMDVERISQWYLAKPKNESMWFVKSACEKEHNLLAIDLTQPHLTEYVDYCYSYVAPAVVPKYELGKVQWKLYKEEKRRLKQVALSAKVDSERAFFYGLGDMEKRARVGQGTGIPETKGKLSLFDAVRIMS